MTNPLPVRHPARLRIAGLALLLSGLFVHSSSAQETKVAPTLVIYGGHVFDADSGVRREAQLWIVDDRILGERPADAIIPRGVTVIDAEGGTVLPGLFDLHAHVFVPGGSMTQWLPIPAEQNLASALDCGVTHVVDLHADESTVFELRDRSRTADDMARLYAAGAAFTAPGGHPAQFGVFTHEVDSETDLDEQFAGLLDHAPDLIKAVQEHGGWGGLPGMPALDEALLARLVDSAHAQGLAVFCHVWTRDEAFAAVEAGVDALAHGVFLGEVDDALIDAMKARGTAYIPTLSVVVGPLRAANGRLPYDHDLVREALHPELVEVLLDPATGSDETSSWVQAMPELDEALYLRNLARLHEAGIPVGIGTDGGNPLTPHGPAVLHEIGLFVEAGLSPAEALSAATLGSARILGVDEAFGSLAPGKVADVVIVDGDPTTDIGALWDVHAVVKAGTPVDRQAIADRNAKAAGPVEVVSAGDETGSGASDVLADFDDGELAGAWGGVFSPFTDSVAGGKSTGEVKIVDDEEGARLRLSGEVTEGFQYGAWSGVVIDWSEGRTRQVDATEYDGIRLRLRGVERPYTFTVQRAAVKDFNVFATSLNVPDEWAVVDIPFDSLRQIGFGAPVDWAQDDLTGLNIDARNNPFAGRTTFGPFVLEIDWICFYRDGE